MLRHTTLALLLAAGAAAACTDTSTGPESDGPSASGSSSDGWSRASVSGQVLDTKGRPLAGAKIWIRPALTTGLAQARTGDDGRYSVTGIIDVPYYAKAWVELTQGGKQYCMRLAMPKASDYEAFTPTANTVRDFRWQLSGPIPGVTDGYFGGHVRLLGDGTYKQSDSVDVTFTPTGPLLDGTAAKAFTRRVGAYDFIYDVPVATYTVSVAVIGRNGTRTPLKVGSSTSPSATSMPLAFQPSGCSDANGTDRAFIFWGS